MSFPKSQVPKAAALIVTTFLAAASGLVQLYQML